jgi:2',3'-cyclic-nucleotide 2'-phosphodiesterase (5'-nucleotidase family)
VARRATAIDQERAASDGVVLVLDAGASLVGAWESFASEGAIIVEAMNAMGYDAMAVGRGDLDLGLEALRQRAAEAQFPFLAANVVSTTDGEPIFEPYVILERAGTRIGLIGIVDQAGEAPAAILGQATIEDPVSAAAAAVAEVRPQVDLLIVLSRLGLAADRDLAAAVPGIDIIVGGNTNEIMEAPVPVGHTLIVQQGYRGEWLGRLDAQFDAQGMPVVATERSIALTEDYADAPQLAARVAEWLQAYPEPTLAP